MSSLTKESEDTEREEEEEEEEERKPSEAGHSLGIMALFSLASWNLLERSARILGPLTGDSRSSNNNIGRAAGPTWRQANHLSAGHCELVNAIVAIGPIWSACRCCGASVQSHVS